MTQYIEFTLLNVELGKDFPITVPSDMTAGEVADILAPHMRKCIIGDIAVKDGPDDGSINECMSIVFDSTDPGEDMTEESAAELISHLKDDGWTIPQILTPSLFVKLYNDLEPDEPARPITWRLNS